MTETPAGYEPLPPHVDLPALEHAVIEQWRESKVFQRSIDATADGPSWTFYEGPPTANGMPGTHHVEARVFKDVFPRYRTMKGFHVPRMAGWDCHGLPVELAVEKELGFTGKPDIEAYGIGAFNAKCRENVQRHVDAFETMSERMGYWADYEHAYWTMTPDYVESVWWALKTIYDKGLLVEDFRVAPYCTRCGTGLSDHEMGQEGVYTNVVDPSVYVRLPLTSGPYAGQASMLIWTTTPWTLPSNALVAVRADVTYTTATNGEETVVVARDLLGKALGDGWQAGEEFTGADMVGWTYRRPFDVVPWPGAGHFVVAEDYVTTDDGTGLVHQATVFGAPDFESVRRNGVELINPIDVRGRFEAGLPLVGGLFFKDADEVIVADLLERGLLFRHVQYEHSYPHCWRCHTPLMYYALPSWYVRTTEIKDRLLAENEATNWFPATIKHGRYGDWLNNNVDWALSRDRFWGTPLPVWRNDLDPAKQVCVGSLAELRELSGVDLADPHRPFVDDVTFTRPGEDGTYRRVPQVIDAWFDSGSMPFAQFGAPYRNADAAQAAYPADFICEAIDQTRGWFYSLMAVGTLVFDQSSYRNVVCLGHILAEDGRKMSKHLGNILEPIPLMDEHGADALRWFMLCSGSPWSSRRVGHKVLEEIASKVIRTYWSVASFQSLYANASGWTPGADAGTPAVLDRWVLSEVHRLAAEVDDALEKLRHRPRRAGARRLHRRPVELVRAPVAAAVLGRRPGRPRHAALLPRRAHPAAGAARPVRHRAGVERTVRDHRRRRLGAPRVLAGVRRGPGRPHARRAGRPDAPAGGARPVRPGRLEDEDPPAALARADLRPGLVGAAGRATGARCATSSTCSSWPASATRVSSCRSSVKANFRELGRRFGKRTQLVAAAIAAADPDALVAAHRAGTATVEVDGETLPIGAGRADRQRDAALGLGGGVGRRGHRGDRPRDHARAAARRAGARDHPAGPGGAQERRARGHRPDRRCGGGSAARRIRPTRSARTSTSCPARCWPCR